MGEMVMMLDAKCGPTVPIYSPEGAKVVAVTEGVEGVEKIDKVGLNGCQTVRCH